MKKLIKGKIILLAGLVVLLAYMLTTVFSPSDDGEYKGSENEASSTQESEPISEPIPATDSSTAVATIPQKYVGDLELPVTGATGYTSIDLNLRTAADVASETIEVLVSGTAFEILEEKGDWWKVKTATSSGWVAHIYCFINLPDVIPSIIYNNTNTYSSEFISSGKSIPDITGQALYSGETYNERLAKEEFILPVLYAMSKKIFLAQQYALGEGNSLVIYEGYRPYTVQQKVVAAVTALANVDPEVMAGIATHPWGMNWFIATSISNHQMGYAIDVSLAEVHSQEEITVGDYLAVEISDYTEYTMPTPIHELSAAAVTFTKPVKSTSPTEWQSSILADTMNEAAINLQRYAVHAGLTPLASEWWHFNDLDAREATKDSSSKGGYILTEVYSTSPKN